MSEIIKQYFSTTAELDMRLDLFLCRSCPNFSRSHLQKFIDEGNVLVNGKIKKSSYKLQLTDEVVLTVPENRDIDIQAENIALDILYEDSDLLVLNKARGMVVHPAAGVYSGTMVNALMAHCSDLSGINGVNRPGIVHRLDKDTSGVMIVAKNDLAHISLAEQIKTKSARRQYLAIVHGNVKNDAGRIETLIGRHPKDRKKMAVCTANGKLAVTEYKVLERFSNYTLVQCDLHTGRTHQIRVHMTYIGYPLVGDPKYGVIKSKWQINGQALHSRSLRFVHPRLGKEMYFEAPVPEDMQKIINHLRK